MGSLFEFRDYKAYLKNLLQHMPKRGHGARKEMAKAMKCQTPYVSHVLTGAAHFSLEQAGELNKFLGHDKEESRFFFLLIQKARAGSKIVREHFEHEIEAMLEARKILKNRIPEINPLDPKQQAIYYGAWYYAAIHIILGVPGCNTREKIASRLQLPLEQVGKVLEFLCAAELIRKQGNEYFAGEARSHLPHDSPFIARHHMNWRLKAVQDLEKGSNESLHYSSVITIRESDAARIKTTLLDTITALKQTIRESKEEEVFSLSMDFFRL